MQKNNAGPSGARYPLRLIEGVLVADGGDDSIVASIARGNERKSVLAAMREANERGIPVPTARTNRDTAYEALELMPSYPQALKGKRGKQRLFRLLRELRADRTVETCEFRGAGRHRREGYRVNGWRYEVRGFLRECANCARIQISASAQKQRAPHAVPYRHWRACADARIPRGCGGLARTPFPSEAGDSVKIEFARFFAVGVRFTATLRAVRCDDSGALAAVIEWTPRRPTPHAAEVQTYRRGRDDALRELAAELGVGVAVAEVRSFRRATAR